MPTVAKDKIVIKRYAEAFLGFASPTIGMNKIIEDFKNIKNILRVNPGFMEFLEHPGIPLAEKNDFIDLVLGDDFSSEFRQFLKLLLEKNRIDKLSDIAEYIRISYSHGEEIEVLLKTTFPLEVELIRSIENKLREKFKRKFKFYIDLDGSLLGGIQVVIGNILIDGSVRKRLDELRQKLKMVRVV